MLLQVIQRHRPAFKKRKGEVPRRSNTALAMVPGLGKSTTLTANRCDMTQQRSSQLTILTIDDDMTVRRSLTAWIEDTGYLPLEAADAAQGLEIVQAEKPDLILLDLRMPVMDGLTFLEKLRALNLGIPVIVVSGLGDLNDAVRAFRLVAWDYIAKPIENFELLEHAVSVVLERRALKAEVRQAEERYRNLVQNIPLVIFSLDESLRLRFVNRGSQAMLGFSQEEALADPNWLMNRIHPEEREAIRRVLAESAKDCSHSFSKTSRLLHKNGQVRHGILKSIPRTPCASDEQQSGVEGVILDITDRLMLEKYLVQKEKLKTLGAVSAEVAHEIRNPLMAIGGFARRLAQKHPDQVEAGIILQESERLEDILNRIRNYLNPVGMHRRRISLAGVVTSCLELLSPELEANEVGPRLAIEAAQTEVEEDPDLMAQVVINLIRATAHTLPPRGEMWLRIFASERLLNLEVGGQREKPVENMETLFLPFDEGGDAFGLPYCYRLLRTMGGSLSYEQKDGRGMFIVSLLAAGIRPEEPEPAAAYRLP